MVSGQRLEGEGRCHRWAVIPLERLSGGLSRWVSENRSLRTPSLHAESDCKVQTPDKGWGPMIQDAVLTEDISGAFL